MQNACQRFTLPSSSYKGRPTAFCWPALRTVAPRARGYLPRHYFSCKNVPVDDLFNVSETTTCRPFKGHAAYFSLGKSKGVAWSYEQSAESMVDGIGAYESIDK
ncbi:DUF427 domain-containing protein [Halomonas citrativorans]|uniref:DUF427 domain-containing protein n=1 Tax=Halomonas citrativorans TaxID=2742612 RepID=A0ABR9FDS5_9GAMM|nr:DUF427 domain-containing protein [Halomonas citrativorans]